MSCRDGRERRRRGLSLGLVLRWSGEIPKEIEGFGLRGTSSGDLLLTPLFVGEPDVVDAVRSLWDVHCPPRGCEEGATDEAVEKDELVDDHEGAMESLAPSLNGR